MPAALLILATQALRMYNPYDMIFSDFDSIVSFMDNYTNLEKNTGSGNLYNVRTYRLDRIRAILERLGNPQNSYKTIHVAGSKGKGSTASYIASAINALSFRTGLYMSPHVSDHRERFLIDGSFADETLLIDTFNKMMSMLEGFSFSGSPDYGNPTTFELYTSYAFMLFKEAGCSWAVIETGMGGRLDATNVIIPQASVITPIELEHTEILGDTIEKIAIEKSKIIKKGIPVFVSLQKPQAQEVFSKEAYSCGSDIHFLSEMVKEINTHTTSCAIQDTDILFSDGLLVHLNLRMIGYVQAYNCALALSVIRSLGLYKEQITERALENNTIPGRMERIAFPCPLFIDGAHTPESMKNSLLTFRSIFPERSGVCIFGSVSGKDYKTMCTQILDVFDRLIICRPGTFKKSNIQEIYDFALSVCKKNQTVCIISDPQQALEKAISWNTPESGILCCGSFYLAGDIKEASCHLTGKNWSL